MRLLDRLLIYSYVKAYLFCLLSLLSLYVIVDLFTNVEDFAGKDTGLSVFLYRVGIYYGYRIPQIFDRLCEALALLAAMFTVAWMQRNNELLPLLSAGISTRRVILPVLWAGGAVLTLGVFNQELLIPRISPYLTLSRDDPDGNHEVPVQGAYEPNGIHVEGALAYRRESKVLKFFVTVPESIANSLFHLRADEAYYVPKSDKPLSGGWLLVNAQPDTVEFNNPKILEMLDKGKFFLHTEEVTLEALTRNKRNWYNVLPTTQLIRELCRPDSQRLAAMAVLFHMRLTRPILGLLLVCLGLSVILFDQNRNIFISAGMCLILCAIFFIVCFACKHCGDQGFLSPVLAAWLPVLLFGPPAFVMFDCIHT